MPYICSIQQQLKAIKVKLTKKNILNSIKKQDMFDYFNCLNMSYPLLKKYYLNNYN